MLQWNDARREVVRAHEVVEGAILLHSQKVTDQELLGGCVVEETEVVVDAPDGTDRIEEILHVDGKWCVISVSLLLWWLLRGGEGVEEGAVLAFQKEFAFLGEQNLVHVVAIKLDILSVQLLRMMMG